MSQTKGTKTMEAKWEVDNWQTDGSVEISDEDIKGCGSVEAAMKMIEDECRRDFEQTVHWVFREHDDMKSEVERLIAEGKAEEEKEEAEAD